MPSRANGRKNSQRMLGVVGNVAFVCSGLHFSKVITEAHRVVLDCVSKVISELLWFCMTSLSDWFKVLTAFSQPIRSETKTNRSSRVHIFPRFVSATCNYFEF